MEEGFSDVPVRLIRVSGVEMNAEVPLPEGFLNESAFLKNMGRKPTFGEIGCYMSHINLLRTFLESDAEMCVICEDDAIPRKNLPELLQFAAQYSSCWDFLRLARCREKGFVPFRTLKTKQNSYSIGTNIKGMAFAPAYMVTRRGAQSLLQNVLPMCVPYDMALFTGWNNCREMSLLPGAFQMNECSDESVIGCGRRTSNPLRYWWSMSVYKIWVRIRRYRIQKQRIRDLQQIQDHQNFQTVEDGEDMKSYNDAQLCENVESESDAQTGGDAQIGENTKSGETR